MTTAVRGLLEHAVAAGLVPGAVASWQLDGQAVREEAVGRARLVPSSEPVNARLHYDLASLTKPLCTAALTLIAAREGRIGLDAELGEALPGCGGSARVTIRQLLAHTSGLPDWVPLASLAGGDPRKAAAALRAVEPVEPPGRVTCYSCVGFLLLGLVLERCFGCRLSHAFRDRVAGPLGLAGGVGFGPDPNQTPLAGGAASARWETALAMQRGEPGYPVPDPAPGLPDDGNARFLGGVAANAGLFGTARSVLDLASIWLPGGALLTDAERTEACRVQTPRDQPARSLGWQLASSPGSSAGPALSTTAIGHTGFTGTSVWIDLGRRSIMVLLSNRHHPDHRGIDLHPLRRRFHALVARGA